MLPLIDADVLCYEIPFACEYGKEELPSWEYVHATLESRIEGICKAVKATAPPKFFLTGKGNFREEIAKTKPYKGNRTAEKPFHYDNIRAFFIHSLSATVVEGYEADDALAILSTSSEEETVICTRDKDLLMVPGWHYGWESGRQGERELHYVEDFGKLYEAPKKICGEGIIFFYFQMLTGDPVDNIPGCPGVGGKGAIKLLRDCTTALEAEAIVWDTYKEKMPEKSLQELREYFIEQGRLLWMIREIDEEGNLVHWEPTIEMDSTDNPPTT